MGEHSTEAELVALRHEWAQAVVENDMQKLERIVGQEYTLAANNFPGGGLAGGGEKFDLHTTVFWRVAALE